MKTQSFFSERTKELFKSRPLYFQIGCIVSLLLVYGTFELTFAAIPEKSSVSAEPEDDFFIYTPAPYKPEETPLQKEKPKQNPQVTPFIKPVPDPVATSFDKPAFISDPQPTANLGLTEINYAKTEESFSVNNVEMVPVFPGCEIVTTNEERKACLSEKISALIKKHFNTSLAEGVGLSGVQKIYVQFSIDKQGKVTNIKAQSAHAALEKEARRVIQLIPQLQPGKHGAKEVEVVYVKPIVFRVQ